MGIGHWPMIRTASLSMHVPSSHWNRTRISRYAPTSMLSQRDIGGTGRALSNCVFLRRLRVRRETLPNPPGKSGDDGPTSSEPSGLDPPTPGSRRPTTGSRSPSAWPMASTTSTTSSPSSCSAAADSTYAYPNQEPNPRKQQKPLTYLLIQGMRDLWYLWLEKDNEGLRKDA